MTTGKFRYDVLMEVDFTDSEFELLWECAKHHYDASVRDIVQSGGFLYGWRNQREMTGSVRAFKSSELDICMKALEQGVPGVVSFGRKELFKKIGEAFIAILDEWKRLNDPT